MEQQSREITANCAVCGGPGDPECPCESAALKTAVAQAEQRWIESWMGLIRQNVTDAAVTAVTNNFHTMRAQRYKTHQQKVQTIPYYSLFVQYRGRPPLNPHLVAHLQRQMLEAESELKRAIDADWKSCVMKYPEILDYYFSMVKVNLPTEGSMLGSRVPSDGTPSEAFGTPSPFATTFPFESELKREKTKRGMRKERGGSDGFGNLAGPGTPLERPPMDRAMPSMERPPMERPATVQPGATGRRRASEGHYYTIAGGRRGPPPPPPPGVPMPPQQQHPQTLPTWMTSRGEARYHM